MRNRLIAVLAAVLFLSSIGAAAWDIQDVDEPVSQEVLSNASVTKQAVHLVDDNGNAVTEEELEDKGYDFDFLYNRSSKNGSLAGNMQHLAEGYYYADFRPNYTNGMIEYDLGGTSPEINLTEKLPAGNNTVEIETDFSQKYRAGKEIEIKASVTDEWSDVNEDGATVHVYFTNGTWSSSLVQLGYNSDKKLYTNNVELPGKSNTTYLVHVNSTTSGATYANPEGSSSVKLETFPSVKGEIAYLNATGGCNNTSFFDACERDVNVDTALRITSSEAKQVELDVVGVNRSDSDWVELSSKDLSKQDGIWKGSFRVPDLDTSRYREKLVLRYNATNGDRQFLLTRNVSYLSYRISDKSSPTTFQGSEYDVELLFAKYFSLEPLNSTRFTNATVTLREPDNDHFLTFQLGDMTYDESEGLFHYTVDIPAEAENGTYSTSIKAYNIHGKKVTLDSGFTVKSIQATFNTSGDLSLALNRTGVWTRNITVANKVGTSKELTWTVEGGIENFSTVNDGDNISLGAEETGEFPVDFNISYVDGYSGDIVINDPETNYNETLDVDIEAPTCALRSGVLCSKNFSDGEVNISRSSRGSTTRNMKLVFLGEKDGSAGVLVTVSGDISSYLSVEPASFSINSTQWIELNYTAVAPGDFSGTINFTAGDDTVSLDTWLKSDVQSTETGLGAPASLDLGYFPSGDTLVREIELENTGEVEITGLDVNSGTYSVDIESASIPPGGTTTVELTFESVTASSGSIEITGLTSVGDVPVQVDVQGNPVPDYVSRSETLSSRITSLSGRTDDEQIENQLQSLEAEISQVETAYQQGNYQQAQQKYQSINSQLDSIEQQINRGSTGQQQQQQQTAQQGGGFPVVTVGVILLVLLVIGFVAYTSIIPEEGDPLYSVLGE